MIGLTKQRIDRIQTVQDNYFKKVADSGTLVCMVRLDSQTLQVKWQIIQKNQASEEDHGPDQQKYLLIAGQKTCDGEDLPNECLAWCKKLNIRCVTKGTDPILAGVKSDEFKLKKGLWAENDKEIRAALNELEKVKEI